jgi:hypothetical protein
VCFYGVEEGLKQLQYTEGYIQNEKKKAQKTKQRDGGSEYTAVQKATKTTINHCTLLTVVICRE